LEENKTLRSYLREIYNIVGHGSTFSDDCPAEMLAVVASEVDSEITEKDEIIAEKEGQISQMENLIKELYAELDKLYGRVAEANADLAECRINLREADAKSTSTTDKYGLMIGRIGQMIPVEFFRTPESTVEQAVALLLERYYSEMATNMYNQNQKLENQ
jgi:septal ring factor EnvC (AmiA/AmiB activator)